MITNLVIAAGVLVMLAVLWRARAGDTTGPQARQLVSSGALLLDVRTPGEFRSGHIQGARNIEVAALTTRFGDLAKDKARPLVVYCHSGSRSRYAARLLRTAGFTRVHNLGAMSNW